MAQARNNYLRYGTVAMGFHWIIAALIVANIALGLWFGEFMGHGDPWRFQVVQLHKAVGLTGLGLRVRRLVWRLMNRVPPLPADLYPAVKAFARFTHYFFYFL